MNKIHFLQRYIIIIIIIALIPLSINGYMSLFLNENTTYTDNTTLYVKNGDIYSDDHILCDSINLKLKFSVTRIYNTEYYKGKITIIDNKYNKAYDIKEKRFYPNSFLGKILEEFNHIGNIGYDFNYYTFEILDLMDGYRAFISYSITTRKTFLRIYKNENILNDYESKKFHINFYT